MADGPTIQKADERALAAGTTPDTVFEIVREIRKESDVPIVFLTYFNIVYRRGIERFYREAHDAGVDGILIADMPVEESEEICAVASGTLSTRSFLSPRQPLMNGSKRLRERHAGTCILLQYSGSPACGTGIRRGNRSPARVRSTPCFRSHSALASQHPHMHRLRPSGADGVIVGSAIVEIVERNLKNPDAMEQELQNYVIGMKQATLPTSMKKFKKPSFYSAPEKTTPINHDIEKHSPSHYKPLACCSIFIAGCTRTTAPPQDTCVYYTCCHTAALATVILSNLSSVTAAKSGPDQRS